MEVLAAWIQGQSCGDEGCIVFINDRDDVGEAALVLLEMERYVVVLVFAGLIRHQMVGPVRISLDELHFSLHQFVLEGYKCVPS